MIDQEKRAAILLLHGQGHGKHKISQLLAISSSTVKTVLQSGVAEVPPMKRPTALDGLTERVVELFHECKGNLVRVHEKLQDEVADVSYTTLRRFCKRHGIGQKPKVPAGTYDFGPGAEMQHDTSPHRVELGGKVRKLQCATLVLAHCRMIFGQVYERWTRLTARGFLSAAIQFFGGAAKRCIVDNSNVVLLHGVGSGAVMTAEMTAFGERFGFVFIAHKLKKPNRKGKVERPFHFVEHNFYPGRTFVDLADCNAQFLLWCNTKNAKRKESLQARPIDLFAEERLHLKPLPVHLPEIFVAEMRSVDLEGWVRLHTNRYSAPVNLIGEQVEVREYLDKVCIYVGPRLIAVHPLLTFGTRDKNRLPEHEVDWTPKPRKGQHKPIAEELQLRAAATEFGGYIDGLKKYHVGRGSQAVKRLLQIWQELPEQSVLAAVRKAEHYRMYDLKRLEKMALRQVAGDFFQLKSALDADIEGEDDES